MVSKYENDVENLNALFQREKTYEYRSEGWCCTYFLKHVFCVKKSKVEGKALKASIFKKYKRKLMYSAENEFYYLMHVLSVAKVFMKNCGLLGVASGKLS